MILSGVTRKRRGVRGLGVLSVPVNGSLIYANPVISSRVSSPPVRQGGPARPVINPDQPAAPIYQPQPQPWGGTPPQATGGSFYGSGYQSPNNPTTQNNLAQLYQLYLSNPSSLTAPQWSQLQAAGVIPSTVPYSNAPLVNPAGSLSTSTAIDPATGVPYATELAAAQAAATTGSASSVIGTDPTTGATTVFGIDWYWLAAGGLVLMYVMSGKRR